ncbi:MAG: SIMPL domain-containing protein [Actinomycetes bacterium]
MQITVVGTHPYERAPERATMHVTIDLEGPDRATTSRDAAALRDSVGSELQRLRDEPGSPLESFSVGPLMTRSWRPPHERGHVLPLQYGASARVRATFADFERLAELMNALAGREGVRLDHVEWTLTDQTRRQVEADALTRAVAEARSRALAIAQASGWAGVDVVEVADPGLLDPDSPWPQPRVMREAMMAGAVGGPGLVPEDIRGEARVHARFVATIERR